MQAPTRPTQRTRTSSRPWRAFWFAGALAAAIALLTLTPLGTYAGNWLTIFEPKHFVGVTLSQADIHDLGGIARLQRYGTLREISRPHALEVSGKSAAAARSRLSLRLPASLPDNVPHQARYEVISRGSADFTFNAARAKRSGTAPAMPAQVDGTTLQLTVGPAVVATFGDQRALHAYERKHVKGYGPSASLSGAMPPALVVAQAPTPRLTSDKASVQDVIEYLAAQRGVPARVAAQIKAISDPASTLPLPIPVNRANADSVRVQGVDGLAIGDNTGVGSGVVWQKDGIVYAVAGSLPMTQILDIANSLR